MFNSRVANNALFSILIAHVLVLSGRDEIWSRFLKPIHYLDLLVTTISVFVVLEVINRVSIYLNAKHGWSQIRLVYQVALGVVIPALLSILITYIQWEFLWGQDLVEDAYFKYEFLPQLLLIVLANLFFIVVYLIQSRPPRSDNSHIIGEKLGAKVNVKLDDIRLIELRHGVVRLITADQDGAILPKSMDHYEAILPNDHFFRANRQVIIHRNSCLSFQSIEHGKIQVDVDYSELIIISQKRAASFRSWIKQN